MVTSLMHGFELKIQNFRLKTKIKQQIWEDGFGDWQIRLEI